MSTTLWVVIGLMFLIVLVAVVAMARDLRKSEERDGLPSFTVKSDDPDAMLRHAYARGMRDTADLITDVGHSYDLLRGKIRLRANEIEKQ